MSKRSGPERGSARVRPAGSTSSPERGRLLALAADVADGKPLDWSDNDSAVLSGLRLIARLSERLGAVVPAAPAASPQKVLFQWGHLDVLERIGEGAASEVFRAHDPLLAIEVALKLSRPGLGWAGTGEWIAEARRLARLRHPNIVAVHGVDRHDGRAGIWLDLIDGTTVDAWGRARGPLPERELCLIGIELCRGLAAIHDAGLLHCDLKPANLLRSHDGRILIADFGASASAQPEGGGRIERGTPLAMAPEVLAGNASSVASDLYGLGVVLSWLATGFLPVQAADVDGLIAAHRAPDRGALEARMKALLSGPLSGLLLSLLASRPEHRPNNAADVERALASILAPVVAPASMSGLQSGVIEFERLIGREAELTYLQQEYRRALAGHALPVLLAGESGTGKSALAARFGDWRADEGGSMLRISLAGSPDGKRLPRALADALARTVTGAARSVTGEEPALLVPALVTAGVRVLCLDDLHCASPGDRAWLRRLAAALRGSPILLLGLIRTDAAQGPDAAALFGDGPVAVLRLATFSPAESEAMLAELLATPTLTPVLPGAVCAQLHRLSGGNPFFLSELLRHLVAVDGLVFDRARGSWRWQAMPDSLPPSLELIALQRCRGLPASSQLVLDAASVLSESIDQDALAHVAGLSVEAVREALAPALTVGILEARTDGVWAFRHGLIRQSLYNAMAPEHRRQLHQRCAEQLRDAREPSRLSALSHHAERAGDVVTAFAAGHDALFKARPQDEDVELAACERLQTLVAAGVRARPAQRWAIALGQIRALRTQGRLSEAQSLADKVAKELRPRLGSAQEDRLRLERASTWSALGRYRCVLAELEPLLTPTGNRRPPVRDCFQVARLLSVRAQAALGEYRQAEASLVQALDDPRLPRRGRLPLQALYGWCIALQGHLAQADHAMQEALHLARDAAPAVRADVLRRMHWVRMCRGHYQSSHALALAAHDAYRSIGDAIGQAKTRMALAQVRLAQGLTEEAVGYLNRAGNELEDIGDRHCEAETRWLLARAEIRLGGHERAAAHLDQALDLIGQIGDRDDEFRFLTEQARLYLAQSRFREAAGSALQAQQIAVDLDSQDGEALACVERAAAELAEGNTHAALALVEPATTTLRVLGNGECWRADWLLGRCRLALRQPDAAVTALADAQAAVDHIVSELDRGDQARRARLRQSWQPLVDDHVGALVAAGREEQAGRLRRRWQRLDS